MQEIWKDIAGYENLYQVSSFGNVRSKDRTIKRNSSYTGNLPLKGRLLKPTINNAGYKRVSLCKAGGTKSFYVHRLVATSFIDNPQVLPFVNHKDENKLNNHVSNLEWCTNEYNMSYGTVGERISKAKSCPVFQYDISGNFLCKYESITKASDITGFSISGIAMCCRKQYHTYMGYVWRLEGDSFSLTKKRAKIVKKYDKNKNLISIYPSLRKAKEAEGITVQKIKKLSSSKKLENGFYWELI